MRTMPAAILTSALATGAAFGETVNFDPLKPGGPPAGWTATQTGKGAAKWSVVGDDSAPSRPNVLKQSGEAAYPVCIKNDTSVKDGFVQVKLRAFSGGARMRTITTSLAPMRLKITSQFTTPSKASAQRRSEPK